MEEFKVQIKELALKSLPTEACGFIYKVGDKYEVIGVRNVAALPNEEFVIDPSFNHNIPNKELIGYFHSHQTGKAEFSGADKTNAEHVNLDSYLYAIATDELVVYKPKGYTQSLTNRDFQWGVSDCWILCLDYYKEKLGLILDHGPLRKCAADVIKNDLGHWVVNYVETCGLFKKKEKNFNNLEEHDLILMNIGANQVNHTAVYLGDRIILHHFPLKNSCKSLLGSYWKNRIVSIYSPIKG